MHGFLGRLADVLARQLLSWLHRRVEPGSREWLDALTAESECADDGWQRLHWALGGVPLVSTINQRRQLNEPTRGTMRALIVPGVANIAAIAGWYAVIIPATYGATHFLRCHLSFGNQPGGCQEHPFVFASIAIGGAVLGMIIALALRARFAADWWAVGVQHGGFCLVSPLRHRRLASVWSNAVGGADGGDLRSSSGRAHSG